MTDDGQESRRARLRMAREALGKSQEEMGRIVGVSGRSWQDYEAGLAVPKVSVYEKLSSAGFNAEWLLSGRGDMLRRAEVFEGRRRPLSRDEMGQIIRDAYVTIPKIAVRAAAGAGSEVYTEGVEAWIYFHLPWLRRAVGAPARNLVIVEATGDSMAPTVDDGDLLLVDVSRPGFTGAGLYVLAVDQDLLVKRLERSLSGGLIVSSDNPAYAQTRQVIEPSESNHLRIIGRVVWAGGRV